MKFQNKYLILTFAVFIINCGKYCFIDNISDSEFVRGVNLENCNINYLQKDLLYNYQSGKFEKLIKNKDYKYYFIATSTPYLCGGPGRVGLEIVKHFSDIYPGQVKFVVSDYYRKDTNRSISEIDNASKLEIFLDINGECIKYLYNKSNLLTEAWYLIIDQRGKIVYAVAKPYEFKYNISESEKAEIVDVFHHYLKQ